MPPAATLAPACQRQWASRSRRGHCASRVDRGVWRAVANAVLPIAGHTKVRPRWCHGQRFLSLNRCPQWPACHLLAGHLLQKNCRLQCRNQRLLRLRCCPLANPTAASGHVVPQRVNALDLLGSHLCRGGSRAWLREHGRSPIIGFPAAGLGGARLCQLLWPPAAGLGGRGWRAWVASS